MAFFPHISSKNKMDKKCTVLLINALGVGGAEGVFVSQANELYQRGWNVYVFLLFARGPLEKKLHLPKDRIFFVGATSIFDLRAVSRLTRYLRSVKCEVLYSTLNEANLIGRIAKIFYWRMNVYTREANMSDVKPFFYKITDVLFGYLSHRIISVSKAVANSTIAYAPWLKTRMSVLYNGINLSNVNLDKPIPDVQHKVRLLTVGSLTSKKDHEILIHAMALLPDKYCLTVVGDGVLRSRLQLLVAELKLDSRVSFTGLMRSEQMADVYRSHDVFVLPSKREGCPNVVAEAESFALPVVVFDIPGMREFVDESAGAIVLHRDPAQLATAIESVSSSPQRLQTLGKGGFRLVSETREQSKQIEKLVGLLAT